MRKGMVIWLTGLPCSGKTTIANKLYRSLNSKDNNWIVLDGDDMRFGSRPITGITGFTEEERHQHLLRTASVANCLTEKNGKNVICAFVSPREKTRQEIKSMLRYMYIVHVKCSQEECARRDVKGMWAKAKAGEIKGFTGFDARYEDPFENSDLVVDTEEMSAIECVDAIKRMINEKHRTDLFIGRWQAPEGLHEGHKTLINESIKANRPVTILIREMFTESKKDPYSAEEIRTKILGSYEREDADVDVLIGPNVGAVCYGRGVGYEIRKIELSEDVEKISATELRKNICNCIDDPIRKYVPVHGQAVEICTECGKQRDRE